MHCNVSVQGGVPYAGWLEPEVQHDHRCLCGNVYGSRRSVNVFIFPLMTRGNACVPLILDIQCYTMYTILYYVYRWYLIYNFSFQLYRWLLQSCTGDFFKVWLSWNLVSGARDGLLDRSVHRVCCLLARVPYVICTKFHSITGDYRNRVDENS